MNFLVQNDYLPHNEDFKSLAEFDAEKSTDLVKSFIKKIKKQLKPTSVNAYVSPIILFFDMNRAPLYKKEISRIKDKNDLEQGGHSPVTDEDLQNMIRISNHPGDISLILFLSSTGMRPGGLLDPVLRVKHLVYMSDPDNPKNTEYCYAVKTYDGSREGYWAFLTPEATRVLNDYFEWCKNERSEVFNDESPIFAKVGLRSDFDYVTRYSLYNLLNKIYGKSGINRIKKGFRYDKALTYMYRIRFNTVLKLNNDVNSNIVEKLMAHKKGLDGTYLQPTREECFTEFVKAIPELTVDPTERQKLEIIEKQNEIEANTVRIKQLEKQDDEIEQLKRNQERLEKMWYEATHKPIPQN